MVISIIKHILKSKEGNKGYILAQGMWYIHNTVIYIHNIVYTINSYII